MNRLLQRKHILPTLTVLCVSVLFLLFPFFALAVDPTTIPSSLEGLVYNMSVGIGGWMLFVAGGLLDYSVDKLVIGMGEYLTGSVGVAVDQLWVLVRDIFNVLFIFGLIYIGFRTILFSEDSSTKKTLGLLIVAALMINFSLFITKSIVDVSNATSFQIYTKMIDEERISSNGILSRTFVQPGSGGYAGRTEGISYAFMNMFRMTTYATGDSIAAYTDNSLLGGRLMFFGLLMMFVMLIAAFVFAAGALLMISRFVGLIIFMIFSPAMFLGFVFPLFKRYQDLWWRKFLQYAFVAPAYLFMLYISLFIINGIGVSGTFASAFEAASFSNGGFIIFMNFFVIAAFLVASLMIAKEMGVYGANASMGMLKSAGRQVRGQAQRMAGGATFGLAGRFGRNTVGWGAQTYSDSAYAKNAESRRGARGVAMRGVGGVARKLGSSSFDARQVAGAGAILGIGEGKKGGYKAIRDDILKSEEAFVKHLGEVDKNDPKVKAHQNQIDKLKNDITEEKEKKNNETDDTKKGKIQNTIDVLQKQLSDKEIDIKREKHRRIIGTESDVARFDSAKKEKTSAQELLTSLRDEHTEIAKQIRQTSPNSPELANLITAKETALGKFNTQKKAVAAARVELSESQKGEIGYVNVLKNSGLLSSGMLMRIPAQDHYAGKKIEENIMKKVKRTKEDDRFAGLSDNIKNISKD